MKAAIEAFDQFLEREGLGFSGTVIGAAALIVLGVVSRVTADVDFLAPRIPEKVKDASRRFAKQYKGPESPLYEDWLNNGPESLIRDLPAGWDGRSVPLYSGRALQLRTLGRLDLLRSKLYAFCDRQQDLEDCVALKPSEAEILECLPWLEERDGNPMWPAHVRKSIAVLAKRLGHGE
jgi:hypothetical protein